MNKFWDVLILFLIKIPTTNFKINDQCHHHLQHHRSSSSTSSSSRTRSSVGSVGIWVVGGVGFWFVTLLSYIAKAQKIRDNKFVNKWPGPLALELKHGKGQILYMQYTFFMLLWERSHKSVLYDFTDCQDSHSSRCPVSCWVYDFHLTVDTWVLPFSTVDVVTPILVNPILFFVLILMLSLFFP